MREAILKTSFAEILL